MAFTEVEALRDLHHAFESLTTGNEIDKILDPIKTQTGNSGALSELHSVSSLHRMIPPISVIEIEPAIPDPSNSTGFLPDKPVDFVGSNGLVYQNASSITGIKRKLADMASSGSPANISTAKVMAHNIMAVENVFGSNTFRFTVSAGNLDDPRLQDAIDAVNDALMTMPTPISRRLSISDIILLPWDS